MQFTKPMIELVFEIRRLVGPGLKPSIKLANPDLFAELEKHYNSGASTVCKALIKELFLLVGEPWNTRIGVTGNPALTTRGAGTRATERLYRGQTQAQEIAAPKTPPKTPEERKRKQRMYRGQVVED